jgi:hypothetical protein
MNKIKRVSNPKIIIYDDENIQYTVGTVGNFGINSGEPIEITAPKDFERKYIPPMYNYFECEIRNCEQLDNIMLDETTMKRIAKYNKEVEIKKLDNTIKEKKDKIKELDNILQDKEGRVKKLKEFVANIYNIALDEDDGDYDYYDD